MMFRRSTSTRPLLSLADYYRSASKASFLGYALRIGSLACFVPSPVDSCLSSRLPSFFLVYILYLSVHTHAYLYIHLYHLFWHFHVPVSTLMFTTETFAVLSRLVSSSIAHLLTRRIQLRQFDAGLVLLLVLARMSGAAPDGPPDQTDQNQHTSSQHRIPDDER